MASWPSSGRELTSLLSACFDLFVISVFYFPHLVFKAGCGRRFCRFLFGAFSSSSSDIGGDRNKILIRGVIIK